MMFGIRGVYWGVLQLVIWPDGKTREPNYEHGPH